MQGDSLALIARRARAADPSTLRESHTDHPVARQFGGGAGQFDAGRTAPRPRRKAYGAEQIQEPGETFGTRLDVLAATFLDTSMRRSGLGHNRPPRSRCLVCS